MINAINKIKAEIEVIKKKLDDNKKIHSTTIGEAKKRTSIMIMNRKSQLDLIIKTSLTLVNGMIEFINKIPLRYNIENNILIDYNKQELRQLTKFKEWLEERQ